MTGMAAWRAMPALLAAGSRITWAIGMSGTAPFPRRCCMRGWARDEESVTMEVTAKSFLRQRQAWSFASCTVSARPLEVVPILFGPGTTTSPSVSWIGTCASPPRTTWTAWFRSLSQPRHVTTRCSVMSRPSRLRSLLLPSLRSSTKPAPGQRGRSSVWQQAATMAKRTASPLNGSQTCSELRETVLPTLRGRSWSPSQAARMLNATAVAITALIPTRVSQRQSGPRKWLRGGVLPSTLSRRSGCPSRAVAAAGRGLSRTWRRPSVITPT
mmetsp:Transcript_53476/g.160014  ORF Transcript_53476/g.160014 Transcript_53476/m.160014 type:complete len:270 (-) Transcript_53476:2170-2979(-)